MLSRKKKFITFTIVSILIFEIIFASVLLLNLLVNIFNRGGTGFIENNIASIDTYNEDNYNFTNQERQFLVKYCLNNVNIFDIEGITVRETGAVHISCDYKDNKNMGHIFLYIKYENIDDLITLKNMLNLKNRIENSDNLSFYSDLYSGITLDSFNKEKRVAYLTITANWLPINYDIKKVPCGERVSNLEDYFIRINEDNRLKKENETKKDISSLIKIFSIINSILFLLVFLYFIYNSKYK